jgi:hypothetical protein
LVEILHHHLGLGVEIVGRQHVARHVRRDLAEKTSFCAPRRDDMNNSENG